MEDAAYFHCSHRPYYLPYRNLYFPYGDQYYFGRANRGNSGSSVEVKFVGRYLKYLKVLAYIQIFIGGVLLITDVSRVILLWNFLTYQGTKLEMVAQISLPIFSLTIGFISLAASYAPSQTFLKILALVFLTAAVPNFVQPKQATYITSALEAIEVSRAASKSAWRGSPEDSAGMIRSEMHNKLARILSFSISPGRAASLGIEDLTSLPTDLLTMLQYLLSTYAVASFLQLLVYGFMLFLILRLLAEQ